MDAMTVGELRELLAGKDGEKVVVVVADREALVLRPTEAPVSYEDALVFTADRTDRGG